MIRNKLRQKNGASIFMGLMFLLVCLMVGTVVLTASGAASGKLSQLKQDEQDYLTVSSAARLLKERIGALTYTHEKIDDNIPTETLTTGSTPDLVILKTELLNLCKILVPSTSPSPAPASSSTEYSFQIDGDATDWDTVYGSLSMKTDGKILVELWLEDSDETDPPKHNRMKLEFSPNGPVVETVITNEPKTNAEGEEIGTITHTTVTTTCSWPEDGCTITKGT